MLNMFSFARLVSYITKISNVLPSQVEITDIHAMVTNCLPEQSPTSRCDDSELHNLLSAMQVGKKIEAIKAHRSLTGYGLKESKDAVEKYWFTRQQD